VQALQWSAQCSSQTDSVANKSADSNRKATTQVNITLPDASYEPASMAVLAGLYQVAPWPELIANLTPHWVLLAAAGTGSSAGRYMVAASSFRGSIGTAAGGNYEW
jgi:hypothetical protein